MAVDDFRISDVSNDQKSGQKKIMEWLNDPALTGSFIVAVKHKKDTGSYSAATKINCHDEKNYDRMIGAIPGIIRALTSLYVSNFGRLPN